MLTNCLRWASQVSNNQVAVAVFLVAGAPSARGRDKSHGTKAMHVRFHTLSRIVHNAYELWVGKSAGESDVWVFTPLDLRMEGGWEKYTFPES